MSEQLLSSVAFNCKSKQVVVAAFIFFLLQQNWVCQQERGGGRGEVLKGFSFLMRSRAQLNWRASLNDFLLDTSMHFLNNTTILTQKDGGDTSFEKFSQGGPRLISIKARQGITNIHGEQKVGQHHPCQFSYKRSQPFRWGWQINARNQDLNVFHACIHT